MGEKAEKFKDLAVIARSHNVPAQLTTLGKRMANWGEEFERSVEAVSRLCATYPYRGLKGAVGTRLDQVTLLGSSRKAEQLDQKVMKHLGATGVWENVGQVYPRSLDFEVVSLLSVWLPLLQVLQKLFELWLVTNFWVRALPRGRQVHRRCRIK